MPTRLVVELCQRHLEAIHLLLIDVVMPEIERPGAGAAGSGDPSGGEDPLMSGYTDKAMAVGDLDPEEVQAATDHRGAGTQRLRLRSPTYSQSRTKRSEMSHGVRRPRGPWPCGGSRSAGATCIQRRRRRQIGGIFRRLYLARIGGRHWDHLCVSAKNLKHLYRLCTGGGWGRGLTDCQVSRLLLKLLPRRCLSVAICSFCSGGLGWLASRCALKLRSALPPDLEEAC